MRFVKNGPDIPERLLQAHEDGDVVFFCGAGISYPAKLPGFSGLVDNIYTELSIRPNLVQQAAIKASRYDTAIGLLEADIVGGRKKVRSALAKILRADLAAPKATSTHEALLTLGRNRKGQTRLVTTNFDRIFETVITSKSLSIERFQAPFLPVPKNRWSGLVYLHGLLTEVPTSSDLDQLVVSSGDFGLAYLTERWAARFVSELFRNYTVCFVGYSINDPVLRYMMDALSADQQRGEPQIEMFAFGEYAKGKEKESFNEWRAKNVTPILYRKHWNHTYLHKTLREWADTHRDGVRGKERIVIECAMALPLASTKEDDYVSRMLWALSDPLGLPAKRFADHNPVPSLDWLEPLGKDRYRQVDLPRFDVPPKKDQDDKLTFSFIRRPSPYDLAPQMAIVNTGEHGSRWDRVMREMGRWLIRHLDDPTLLLWLAKQGGKLHDDFVWFIEKRLDELFKLEGKNSKIELEDIRANAPKAIPSLLMRTLWRLMLTGRVKTWRHNYFLFDWISRFNRDGLTTTLRLELREMLTPRVSIREPFNWPKEVDKKKDPEHIKDLVEWEIVLTADDVHSTFSDLSKHERWTKALPNLLSDFTSLLRDALDLMRELGGVEDRYDLSYIHHPSISDHPQNNDFHDWSALINLSRDAWLAVVAESPERARIVAETWWDTPYPLFKRLAFFAAAQEQVIPYRRTLSWLLADEGWWLWSVETEREAIRLLVSIAPRIDEAIMADLVEAILNGPPRIMFKDDIEPERWDQIVDGEIWLRLKKMNQTGADLSAVGKKRLSELTYRYPQWKLADDDRDEFPFRLGDGDELRKFIATPKPRRELVKWLKKHPGTDHWQEDENDWRQRCSNNFATTACALCALAKEDVWPTERWREALQAWAEEKLIKRSWRYMGPVLTGAPDEVLDSLTHGISWWLQSIAKTFDHYEELFFKLASRILSLDYKGNSDTGDPVSQAINHPVGHVTEALLRWWYRRTLEDGQGLPDKIKTIFSQLCDTQFEKFRHGRVLLATHVIVFFRVDRDWTIHNLLPLFDWHNSEIEAHAAWDGFLWSPRIYRPLMELFKTAFLDTAHHYSLLGNNVGRQYVSLLTFVALDRLDTFTATELASATRSLPQEGLSEAVDALVRAMEGSGEQRSEYWKNRIIPYLRDIWPKTRDITSPAISKSFAHLCIASQDAFPDALKLLRAWLQPIEYPNSIVHKLCGTELCSKYPEEVLDFLVLIMGDPSQWPPTDLYTCLKAICSVKPELKTDERFEKLITYLRQYRRDLT